MHAELKAVDDGDTPREADSATPGVETFDASPRVAHSIMDVLMPAKPPQPKNARIIRLFDIEAAKNDPRPAASDVEKTQQERKNRDEARALRNRSLLAAAGLA